MNYTIIEQQTNAQGTTVIVTPVIYDNDITAESEFLFKSGYARRSGLPCHSVVLLDQKGKQIARVCYPKETT